MHWLQLGLASGLYEKYNVTSLHGIMIVECAKRFQNYSTPYIPLSIWLKNC